MRSSVVENISRGVVAIGAAIEGTTFQANDTLNSREYPGFAVLLGNIQADQAGTLSIFQASTPAELAANPPVTPPAIVTVIPHAVGVAGTPITVVLRFPWIRMRYVNGAAATTSFRLYVCVQE